ncbi:MAG: AMP-binding protein, partial [Leptolyngbyaceae cyanobacterium MO_188.B28]|nr:AMP-binding protein [Leptolyngbyaceae cyanobacterium MO_188.B28]
MGKSEVGRVGAWGKEAGMPKAIAHGPEFPNPANMPQSMTDALRQASQTDAGIYHVDAAGAETLQTYSTLWKDAAQIAAGLQSCGLGAGDFVILQFSSNVDFIAALWGCFLRGCTPAPISAYPSSNQAPPLFAALQLLEHPLFLTDQRLSASLSSTLETRALKDRPQALNPSTEPSRLLTIEKLRHIGSKSSLGDFLAADFQADDLALLLLTSGSTGEPKGVMLTHQNLQASVYGMATVNRLSAADITLNWMPLEHVASLVMFHITEVFLGCSQVHVANEWVLKAPLTWLDLIERYRATATWAPNFAYGLVNQQEAVIKQRHWDLTSLRWMGNGAEAVVGRTTRRFLQLLEPHGLAPTVVSPGYGMSETCSGIVHSDQFSLESTSDDDVWVNVGAPIPGVSMRIVDESNQLAQEGETGQLQVKGLTVMTGYYQRPDLNAEAFTADGWLKTGDLGFLQNGRLTITGRQKDVIILNGVNYYSLEIERAVNGLEGVDATLTAACGVRRLDDVTDQLAIFFHPLLTPIAAQTDPAPIIPLVRRIRGQVAQQIGVSPAYVIPVEAEEIPKTSIGKIQRSKLSQQFASGAFETRVQQVAQALKAEHRQASDRPRTDLERQIAEIWRSVLKIEAVGNHDNFFELGGTSLGLMQVLNRLQTTIAPTLTAVTLFQQSTVATLAAYLNQEAASQQPLKVRSHLRAQTSHQTDVAVIGMAGRFPGANNLQEFWRNLCDGVESISSFTDDEILASGIPPSLLQHPNYVKASPILEDVDYFDAAFFGYSPKEAELTDPQQRLLLECAWESLETAGYNPLTYAGSIGLYAGASMNTYLLNHVYPQRHTLDPNDPLEVFTLSSLGGFQATVANDKDYLTTRVSYKLNLRGPSVNVQTACSTALTAVHMAAQSVLQGECDLALAGGVSVETPQRAGYLYQDGMILSPDGHCRAFDAQAQGTLFGSGVGLVVLKRLDAAIADRDFIYAVIKGSAMGNDGGQKVGYLAPRSEGQATVAAEALAIANIPADTLGYVEAHGTGTALGDPIEIAGLTQAFSLTTSARQFCPIGSVKTNVGHLNIASGIVGFIKTVLALHHRQIPASLHFEQANPQIDFTNSPFYVNTSLANWPKGETPRRASVNSLGIGGTNVHVVLEEADGNGNEEFRQALAPATQPLTTVFTLSAKDQTALRALGRRYLTFLSDHPHLSIADVCFTANTGRAHFSHRQAFVADSAECLRDQLRDWLSDNPDGDTNDSHTENESNGSPSGNSLEIAFLFTGQGAQSVNMGRTLYDTQPVFRETLNRCAAILKTFDIPLLALIYPDLQPETDLQQSETEASPLPDVATDPASQLAQTIHTQPALFAIEYALAQLWISWGVRPSAVLGHSVGEYVAACLAGVFSLEDALKLIATRGRLMQQLPVGGAMVSVQASQAISQAVIEVCGNEATIAAINGPQSTVISGSISAVARIIQEFDEKGVKHTPLKVSHAFHSPLMEPMLAQFESVAREVSYAPPRLSLVSNVSGELAGAEVADARYWCRHVREAVRFASGMAELHRRGTQVYLEVGPAPVLVGMGRGCVPDGEGVWLASLRRGHSEWAQMLGSLGELYVRGVEIDWAG